MELVDTHCHIQSIGLESGERTTRELWARGADISAESVVQTAVEASVTRLICVGCDLEDSELAVDFVVDRDNCWASIGLHPHEAKHYVGKQDRLDQFSALVKQPKVIAVGECGLDLHYEHSPLADQIKILEFQLQLAVDADLPVIFHVREAFDDFWPIFNNFTGIRGVLHSFTDTQRNVNKALDEGLLLGVNGIATFTADNDQIAMYQSIPLSNLLLETDSPFLAPLPERGKVNQPKNVNHVADFLAELRGEDRQDLAKATTTNARELFGI